MTQTPEIYIIVAGQRRVPKSLPVFPNPEVRPEGEGDLPPLVLDFVSPVPRGVDIALGRVPKRNAAAIVDAIRSAGDRSIQVSIDDPGGDSEGSLQIAIALLQHEFAVHCRIVGRCSSAAICLALAADTRTIVSAGSVLVHGACRIFVPEQFENYRRIPIAQKQTVSDSLNDIDDAQTAFLVQRLGVSEATARQWLLEDRKWDAAEALSLGFVHEVEA